MDNTVYTVDYFIKKFEAIAENLWDVFTVGPIDMDGTKPHCALGWCKGESHHAYGLGADGKNTEGSALRELLDPLVKTDDLSVWSMTVINDGQHKDYQQPTPKQRILAALYDIKAKQQPEVKERIVYVTVDKEVRELQKTELIEN